MIVAGRGRPIRFFLLLFTAWVAFRATAYVEWISPDRHYVPNVAIASGAPKLAAPHNVSADVAIKPSPLVHRLTTQVYRRKPARPSLANDDRIRVDLMNFIAFADALSNRHYGGEQAGEAVLSTHPLSTTPMISPPPAGPRDRWRMSSWMLWRDGSSASTGYSAVRLGGSQVGTRLDFDATPDARSAMLAYGRFSAALNRPAAPESAVGVAYQPDRRIPISIAAERRIALGSGARNAMALVAVGGFGPTPIGASLMGEGYAQAGIVGFSRRDGFIDGKLSAFTPLGGSSAKLGAAMSGGAQPGASRLDIGPELRLPIPLPDAYARLSVEWRTRVAGNAAPASGLALTLAADF